MEDSVDLDEILAERIEAFENAEDATRTAREKSEKCQDYFDDKQWTDDEVAKIEKRGQPVSTFNEIKPKVNTMLGLEKQTRKDPKAFPRTPGDEQAAQAATDVIRYVCEDTNWDDKRSQAAKDLAVPGTCSIMVGLKQTRVGVDPDIRRIAWDRFYYDPASSEFDFADAKFMGIVIWMDLDDAVRKYPEAAEILESTWSRARNTQTYDDKPKHGLWADYKRRRVRLCEEYYDEGGWKFCIYTEAGFIAEPMESPYLDADGLPECPIKAVSLYVGRDNNRYGEVQSMLSPQDDVNKRHSKALHVINTKAVRIGIGSGMSADDVRKELARPDGVFIADQGELDILPDNDVAAGNLQLLSYSRDFIHRTGANSALAGKDVRNQSGRAITAQQQGGMIETASYLDAIRVLSLAVYRSVWARVRQSWTGERWVRVTDDKRNLQFVGVNRPVTALHEAAKRLGVDKDNLQQADPQAVAMLEAFARDPRSQTVIGVDNSIAEMDVDIIVEEGIDTPTVQAEQFDVVAKMLPGAPPNLQPVLWEALFENSAFRNKDKVLKALSQPPSPEQQQMKKLQVANATAELEKTQSETVENNATAQARQFGILSDAYKAGAAA